MIVTDEAVVYLGERVLTDPATARPCIARFSVLYWRQLVNDDLSGEVLPGQSLRITYSDEQGLAFHAETLLPQLCRPITEILNRYVNKFVFAVLLLALERDQLWAKKQR